MMDQEHLDDQPAAKVVCFGEPLLRLGTPVGSRLADTSTLDVVVGGAEVNVAVALSVMGHDAHFLGCVPPNPLGDQVARGLASARVGTRFLASRPGRMGLYFYEAGASLRTSAVTYDRDSSAFARATPGDLPFREALAGARLLHLSGITAALAPETIDLCRAAIDAARDAGAMISFDPNHRSHLWNAWQGDARAALAELAAAADILFANHRDMELLFGRRFANETMEDRRACAEAAFAEFPNLRVMACTRRVALSQSRHQLAARVDLRRDSYETPIIEVDQIVDRIGSGDAFAAGVLCGWLEDGDAGRMATLGLAMNALKHSTHGDMLRANRSEVEAFLGFGRDINR